MTRKTNNECAGNRGIPPLPRQAEPNGEPAAQSQKKRTKRDVHGWIVLDKPVGMTSTHAVSVIKHLYSAKRAGHAGTLDPLASGCLPIALGEATKTVPFVVDSRKTYQFTIRWGEERDTDDAEGRVVASSENRPDAAAIRALLPRFIGTIAQVPPRFSAVKIDGERAYDLARDGETVELAPARGDNLPPRPRGNPGSRPCRSDRRMWQRDLCTLACPRSRAGRWACSATFRHCAGAGSDLSGRPI